MKIIIAAAAALSLSILNTFATSQDDAFQKVAHDYVEQYLQANPEAGDSSSVTIVLMAS